MMKRNIYSLSLAALLCLAGTNVQAELTQVGGVYQIGTAQDLVDFSTAINTEAIENTSSCVITADIDLTGINFQPIGFVSAKEFPNYTDIDQINFYGTIDGQGHIIKNLTINDTDYHEAGLVSRLRGTIKNLGIVNASITTNNPWCRAAAFAGYVDNNGTLENCFATGEIKLTLTAEEYGQFSHDGSGGLVGSVSGCTIKNCYITYGKLVGYNWGSTITNTYWGDNASGEKLASGEFCYQINQTAGSTIYYQKLGEGGDAYPVLDATHGTVYMKGNYQCDGKTPKEGGTVEYTNDPNASNIDDHNFVDGICSVCGAVDKTYLTPVGGVYQIGTPAQLCWFAKAINTEAIPSTSSCAITADIDMSSVANFQPIGRVSAVKSPSYTEIDNIWFRGNIDGQGHIISNLTIVDIKFHESALVSRLSGGTIKNLGIVNISVTTNNPWGRASVFAGFAHDNAQITNCFSAGNIVLTANAPEYDQPQDADQRAGIYGGNYNVTVTNCYTTYGKVNGQDPYNTITNSFAGIAADKLTSGELAYQINQGAGQTIYYQTLGEDEYPVLSNASAVVYKTNDAGISTYYGTEAVTFNGVNVYTGYVEGNAVKLTKQQNTIPANTAVVIEGTYYNRLTAENAPAITGTNSLVGSTTAVKSNGTQYALALSDDTPAFMKVRSGVEIPAGKAYIVSTSGVKSLSIGGGETGLNEVTTDNGQQTTVVYDLQGRRVANATKGIYIINGKKVLR